MKRNTAVLAVACAFATTQLACSKSQSNADAASAGPIEIAAADLAKAYKADRARADATYTGKRVRVSGMVGEARVGAFMLGNEGDSDAVVQCAFAPEYAKAGTSIAKDVRITLDCDCEGMKADVTLTRCKFGSAAASSASAQSGPTATEVCTKLEAAGIATKCRASDGSGERTRFDLVSLPGKSGLVVRLADDATYAKYAASLEAQPPTSPLRPFFTSAKPRIAVHLPTGLAPDVEAKTKSLVDAL